MYTLSSLIAAYEGYIAETETSEVGSLLSVNHTYQSTSLDTTYLSGAHDGRHKSSSSPRSKRPVLVVHYDLRVARRDGEWYLS